MDKKLVVLVSGKKCSGKDTFAGILNEFVNGQAFLCWYAKSLKDNIDTDFTILKDVLGELRNELGAIITSNSCIDEEVATDLAKFLDTEMILDTRNWYEKNKISRALMQIYGTDIFRKRVDDNYWVNQAVSTVLNDPRPIAVISDVRFPNEVTAFNGIDNVDVLTVRINRPSVETGDTHESETALDDYKWWHVTIDNSGTIDDLRHKVVGVVSELIGRHSWLKDALSL